MGKVWSGENGRSIVTTLTVLAEARLSRHLVRPGAVAGAGDLHAPQVLVVAEEVVFLAPVVKSKVMSTYFKVRAKYGFFLFFF